MDQLMLDSLKKGDVIHITTGLGELAFKYTFTVEKPGTWPEGHIHEVGPDGQINQGDFTLQGSGRWTDRKQNPVQDQDIAFSSEFTHLSVGTFMVGATSNGRLLFDKPGQEISEISVTKT